MLRCLGSYSHIESSQSLRQNDAKLQTHLPITLNNNNDNVKMFVPFNVYHVQHKISVGNATKVFCSFTQVCK